MGSGSMGWHAPSPREKMDQVMSFLINLSNDLGKDIFAGSYSYEEMQRFYLGISNWCAHIKEIADKLNETENKG